MNRVSILFPFVFLCLAATLHAGEPSSSPISFSYDDRPADLSTFRVEEKSEKETEAYSAWRRTFSAPDGRLRIEIDGKTYKKFPAVEYAVTLVNLSDKEATGIVGDFQSFDAIVSFSGEAKTVTLDTLRGSNCVAEDFAPISVELAPGQNHTFSTPSGRSSNEVMPFIELNLDERNGRLYAVGWTGSWAGRFASGDKGIKVRIGMDHTRFRLLPGERIRQPSVVVFNRENQTRREFKTVIHRFLMENKVPRDSRGKIIPPVLAVAAGGGNKTPKMMLDSLQYVLDNKMPFNTYWVDAGWYGPPHQPDHASNCGHDWWKYVGDWRVNTTVHPTGTLLPIADAVHKAGMKFLLWFEPERTHPETPIRSEHPEYFHGDLLDMGNPEARQWISKIVYGMIDRHKIDVYRQDFNMDPGSAWETVDKANPDRVGIAEAKHITGVYEFLDEMRRRFPDILQENCASGGRRLDVEMVSRAHAYCRSDYFIGLKPGDSAFVLGQNTTLNTLAYLPFQGCEFCCVPVGDDYAAMSILSSGAVITFSDYDGATVRRSFSDEDTAWFNKIFATEKRMQEYYLGDFYPLCEETTAANDLWCGWQMDRPDLDAGFALVFRRGDATEESKTFHLGNIDAGVEYELEFFDGTKKTVKGGELADLKVSLKPRSFRLVFYKKK